MPRTRQMQFCSRCESRTVFDWSEPPHNVFSALTLALIGGGYVTPIVGSLMLGVWLHRISSTRAWNCLCCGSPC